METGKRCRSHHQVRPAGSTLCQLFAPKTVHVGQDTCPSLLGWFGPIFVDERGMMLSPAVNSWSSIKKTALLSIAGTLISAALFFTLAAPRAWAGEYCGTASSPAWVNPYGQGGDKCWGPAVSQLTFATVRTYERAACVTIAEGTDFLTSWVCGAAGSAPEYAASASKFNPKYSWKGVIRNNNLTYGTHVSGWYACTYYQC